MSTHIRRAIGSVLMLAGFVVFLWAAGNIYFPVSEWFVRRTTEGAAGGPQETIIEIAVSNPRSILNVVTGVIEIRLMLAISSLRAAIVGSGPSAAITQPDAVPPTTARGYEMGAHVALWAGIALLVGGIVSGPFFVNWVSMLRNLHSDEARLSYQLLMYQIPNAFVYFVLAAALFRLRRMLLDALAVSYDAPAA
jgi:hypothetical protein